MKYTLKEDYKSLKKGEVFTLLDYKGLGPYTVLDKNNIEHKISAFSGFILKKLENENRNTYGETWKINDPDLWKLKPIHKFNNGNKATLCIICSKIIDTDFTENLYCENHLTK